MEHQDDAPRDLLGDAPTGASLPDGRPPVEAEDAGATDALTRQLLPSLDLATEQDLASLVMSDYHAAVADRSVWESNLDMWDRQYHGILPEKTWPWPGCSNLPIPLTQLAVETMKPRLGEAVLGNDPPVFVRPAKTGNADRAELVEMFLNWQVKTQLGIEALVQDAAHLFLNPGTVVAKVWWKQERRVVKMIRNFPARFGLEAVFSAVFDGQTPLRLRQIGDLHWEGTLPSQPVPQPFTLTLQVQDNEIRALIEKDAIVTDKPHIELIDARDFIVPSRAGSDVQRLPWVQHRLWLTEDDLRRKVRLGRFDRDAVARLLGEQQTGEDTAPGQADAQQETRAEVQGQEPQGESHVKQDLYEVLEDYRRYDLDEDGWSEELIVWVSPHLPDRVLGWDYLDNVYAHGRRPFIAGRYLALPFEFYGVSLPEVIRPLQEELNTIHNQRVDAGTIQNTPFGVYRASMTVAPTTHRIRPGEWVPADDPDRDIKFPQLNGSSVFGQAEEALLYQYFERLTGLTDITLGRQANRVGATRTASGTAALLSEAGLRFKTPMEAFQRFWRDVFEHVLLLDQQYLPPGVEFRVTGHWPEQVRIADRTEIAGSYDLRLSTVSETLNKAVLREDATLRLQTLLNPVVLQSGLVGLKGIHRALRQVLRAYGEPDPDALLEVPRTQMIHTPEEELSMLVHEDVEPSPQENLEYHLQQHTLQYREPVMRQALGLTGLERLGRHLARTAQLLQMRSLAAAAPRGAGAAPVGPQARNAEIGRQAPTTPTTAAMARGGPTSPTIP